MSQREGQSSKRQFFRGLTGKKTNSLEASTSNLLSRTLRKNSDRYKISSSGGNGGTQSSDFSTDVTSDDSFSAPVTEDGQLRFVIHKSAKPEEAQVYSSRPIRTSKLKAFEQAEEALGEVFHHHTKYGDISDDDDDDEVTDERFKDEILISIPGFERNESLYSGRSKKTSQFQRAFHSREYVRSPVSHSQEYYLMNKEFHDHLTHLEQKLRNKNHYLSYDYLEEMDSDDEDMFSKNMEVLTHAVSELKNDSWMFSS